jgi:uncharacterized membrane protein
MNKKKVGWILIALIAMVDFALISNLILEGNAAPFTAILAACLFICGLDGGPAFLAMGLVEFFDKTRTASGTGKTKSIVYMVVGSLCTIVTFTGYFFIRRDAIVVAGGFNGSRYDGFYGDIVLMLVPFITSLIAFGVALWFSSNGIDEAKAELQKAQEEYDEALQEKRKAVSELESNISTIWSRHFPDEDMNISHNEAVALIKRKIVSEMESRFNILLPQIINETNLISSFNTSFKELYRNHVDDENYLSVVNISDFKTESLIGSEYARLQSTIEPTIDRIITTVCKRRLAS